MNSPHKIEAYLEARNVPYEIVLHKRPLSSLDTAQAAHIEAHRVAKAVLLEGDGCFMAALVPADQEIRLAKLIQDYGPHLRLADEDAINTLFEDCDSGAVPGFPPAWGMETVWDDDLLAQPDVYLDAGDHERLIHVETRYLRELLAELAHCHFSGPKKRH
jgi:Ala-tRNA(Pro) deacylase